MKVLSGSVMFNFGPLLEGVRNFHPALVKNPQDVLRPLLGPLNSQCVFNIYYVDDVFMISPIRLNSSARQRCQYINEEVSIPLNGNQVVAVSDVENLKLDPSGYETPDLTAKFFPDKMSFTFQFVPVRHGSGDLRYWYEYPEYQTVHGKRVAMVTCFSLRISAISQLDIKDYFELSVEGPSDSEEQLPEFKYHPHPVITGAIIPSRHACVVCKKERGFVYANVPYAADEYIEEICPWCISSGDAAKALEVEFIDLMPIAMYTGSDPTMESCDTRIYCHMPRVSQDIQREIIDRTPGFVGLQTECWMVCCDHPCAYIGTLTPEKSDPSVFLEPYPDEADHFIKTTYPNIKKRIEGAHDTVYAYLFRCLQCHQIGFYTDQA